jgi:hypothetical protein
MFGSLNKIKEIDLLSYFFNNGDKKSILDPLTCIIRLAILSFKPVGTKISVYENKISYNDPCVLQGPVRWSYGDKRGDLHNLYNPIKKAILWYDVNDKEIKGIIKYTINGINNLKKSYDTNSIITHSLDHYITLLTNSEDQNEIKNTHEDTYNIIYKNLKELWSDREINIVYNILLELDKVKKMKDQRDKVNALISSIDSILSMKEVYVNKLLIDSTTILK